MLSRFKTKTSAANDSGMGHQNGWMAYYLGKNPFTALINVLYYSLKSPHYTGAAYLWGYFGSAIRREKRIQDSEIKAYYRNQRLAEVFSTISEIFSRNSKDAREREQ